jgi:hypothetical protein
MTNPITPPPELVSKWCYEDGEEIKSSPRWFYSVCAKAAQWGADTELEACCEWLKRKGWEYCPDPLRAARRPKPPSLKEQALKDLTVMTTVPPGMDPLSPETTERISRIRRALEALPDE